MCEVVIEDKTYFISINNDLSKFDNNLVKTILTPMPAELKENPNQYNLNKNWSNIMENEANRV